MNNKSLTKPTISKERQAQLSALALRDDSDIDLTDCPEVTDWSGAVRGKIKIPKTDNATIALQTFHRLDDDVIQILATHNSDLDLKRINGVIRSMFATA